MFIKIIPKNIFFFLLATSFLYLAYLIWTAKESLPQIDVQIKDIVSYIVIAVEMGGSAVSRIYAENKINMEIYQKGQMDVGRAELLTKADLISNTLILQLLRRFSLLKVITEEKISSIKQREVEKYRTDNYEIWLGLREILSRIPEWRVPLNRVVIWVDPLDATQEYTEGLTQYVTVMACIVVDGKPFVGVIHSPFKNETVLGIVDYGLISSKTGPIKISQQRNEAATQNKTVIISRSHAGEVSELIQRAFADEPIPYVVEPAGGAGYKTLRLIQQTADLYVHTTTIKKWDICAGDAIIRAAGGALLSLSDGLPLDYSLRRGQKDGEVHTGGILMALSSPYSAYEKLKKYS